MILGHRIRLIPTSDQAAYFQRGCDVARFAYNWALARWEQQRRLGQKLSEAAIRRQLNAIKRETFPWMCAVAKTAPQQAVKNLGRAYANFFSDLAKYERREIPYKRIRTPRFKKKGVNDAFRADNGTDRRNPDAVLVRGKRVKLPVIGWVRMCEEVRFAGNIRSVTICRRADAWYASFQIETHFEPEPRTDRSRVGVDLGLTALATLSDRSIIAPPKPLRWHLRQLKRLSRSLARKQRGSKNRAKARTKLARLHRRIADIRSDALHKLTTRLMGYGIIVIEDLNVAGMLQNRNLSRTIADVGLREFRRQVSYKAALAGSTLIIANRWYPSSKLCSACSVKNNTLTLSQRFWTCTSCGASHDRDLNAAVNLARYPESWAGTACGANGADDDQEIVVKPSA